MTPLRCRYLTVPLRVKQGNSPAIVMFLGKLRTESWEVGDWFTQHYPALPSWESCGCWINKITQLSKQCRNMILPSCTKILCAQFSCPFPRCSFDETYNLCRYDTDSAIKGGCTEIWDALHSETARQRQHASTSPRLKMRLKRCCSGFEDGQGMGTFCCLTFLFFLLLCFELFVHRLFVLFVLILDHPDHHDHHISQEASLCLCHKFISSLNSLVWGRRRLNYWAPISCQGQQEPSWVLGWRSGTGRWWEMGVIKIHR